VRSTTTDSPISGRSSATTFCIITHCSEVAPAGVSHMIDHAPWVERTVPLGCAAPAIPEAPTMHKAASRMTFAKGFEGSDLESQAVMKAPLRITAL
jgi:hypothetical protein